MKVTITHLFSSYQVRIDIIAVGLNWEIDFSLNFFNLLF